MLCKASPEIISVGLMRKTTGVNIDRFLLYGKDGTVYNPDPLVIGSYVVTRISSLS